MDPRVREHAEIIANHSVEIAAGDHVIIDANHHARDLVVALHEAVGDREAHPVTITERTGTDARRAYLKALPREVDTADHHLALVEAADVYITIKGYGNVSELADVSPEMSAAHRRAIGPIQAARLDTRWVVTQFPAAGDAQLAGMSSAEYENFVWDAVAQDWAERREFQQPMADRLNEADEVHIASGEETDIHMRIGGNTARNDFGERNLPGGEVFTAPIPDSVEGRVRFDMPFYLDGKEIEDAYLVFEGGEVVDHRAGKHEDLLAELLDTDPGARRLGELGIGMNRDIDRFTYNMLLDEKMGDTVHLALGRAYEDNVGPDNEQNESAVHADMIIDMSADSHIALDGEVVQRDGTFYFEDGFEAA